MEIIEKERAQIFLADRRYRYQTSEYRTLRTEISNKGVPSEVQMLYDDTLAQGRTRSFVADSSVLILLLPLVGTIEFECLNRGHHQKIAPEELLVFPLHQGEAYTITNSSNSDLANYIQIWFKINAFPKHLSYGDYVHNRLNTIYQINSTRVHFGVFDGRKEARLDMQKPKYQNLVFVINGAFEVQERLLESRDALLLTNVSRLEMEALSENGIILILEIPSS
ncbi:hypothetical protein [Ulvibacterium sp.]|uniref:pirin family protein n=1 Tax=Ulvibacterium sp. TaxID=2665914 RepID=UPI003CC52E5C